MNLIVRRPVLAMAVLILIWGFGYPVIKIGLQYAPPLLFAGLRAIVGGLALGLLALLHGGGPNLRNDWRAMFWSALLNVALFFALSTLSVRHLPAGLASVILYLQPMLVGVMAHFWLGERLSRVKSLGLVLGFAGVAVIGLRSVGGDISAGGIWLGVASALAWALGTVAMKRARPSSLYWYLSLPFLAGGVVVLLVGWMAGESWGAIEWNGVFIAALLWGSVIGLASSWLIWITLVRVGQASRVAANTFYVPMVALLVGAIFLDEQITPTIIAGSALIVYGVRLVNRSSAA